MVESDRIYAWHTRFHSLTLRYMYNPNFTVFSQLLVGDTLMGKSIVDNDFKSGFVAAVYSMTPYTFATRADWYQVNDNDNYALDPNGSAGRAFTISAGRNISEHFSITAEWQVNSGNQQNLRFFQDNEHFTEHLFQLALTATF